MIWFKFYSAWGEGLQELSDAEAGRFIKALCACAESKEIPVLSGAEKVMYAIASKQLKQDVEHSAEVSRVRAQARRSVGSQQMITNDNNSYQKEQMISNDNKCSLEETKKSNDNNSSIKNKELRIKNQEEELREIAQSAKPTKPKPTKHKYGSFDNVLLTDAEFQKLHERFLDADDRIESFSQKKEAKGYSYKSDYAAILTWAENDAKRSAEQPKVQQKSQPQTAFQMLEEMGLV